MGLFVRAALWALGIAAFIVAGLTVYAAFFGPASNGPPLLSAKLTCPPLTSMPPRASGAPVDDVALVRLGYTIEDAQATLRCRNPNYVFTFDPIWHTAVPADVRSRQRMLASAGPERIWLGLVGEREREIVYGVFQDILYPERTPTPTPQAGLDLIIHHYGPPHDRQVGPTRIDMWWLYSPNGKPTRAPAPPGADPITAFTSWVRGNWDFSACQRSLTLDPLASASWNDQCGISVHAQIDIDKYDKTRITRYRIVLIDQARLGAGVENYRERMGVKPIP